MNLAPEELEMALAYEIHAPIYIDGDGNLSDTAQAESWQGDGGKDTPFLIEAYSIDLGGAPGNCITIYNTSLYVIVRDCFFTGATTTLMAGIRLENVTNCILDGNTFFDNSYGIYLHNSHHNIVRNNNCTMNSRGVVFEYDSVLNEFYNNTFSWNWVYGISLESSGGNEFLNNTFLHNDVGVRVGDGCSANDFRKNFFIMNHFDALLFVGTGRDNFVFWNTFHLNMISVTDHSADGNYFGHNYYSGYSDFDQQGDGIYDRPYIHFGTAGSIDYNPLVYVPMPPVWGQTPTDQTVELGEVVVYGLNVLSSPPIKSWRINDTLHFKVDHDGVVTDNGNLNVGRYNLEVHVTDLYGNSIVAHLSVIVGDTTAPVWIISPEDQSFLYGTQVNIWIGAWDLSGIAGFTLSDTVNFTLTSSSYGEAGFAGVRTVTTLEPGNYALSITVYDTNQNEVVASFSVTIVDAEAEALSPVWIVTPISLAGIA
ncbi:MAG: nitrous oxide reductase family maturation protein NosD, partial [Candidatus Thorarchaeota archaeon]